MRTNLGTHHSISSYAKMLITECGFRYRKDAFTLAKIFIKGCKNGLHFTDKGN
jgi:hypothetical protein